MKTILALASLTIVLTSFNAQADAKRSDGQNLCKLSIGWAAQAVTYERIAYALLIENKDAARSEQRKRELDQAAKETERAFSSISATCID